jgi:hypothetical protein
VRRRLVPAGGGQCRVHPLSGWHSRRRRRHDCARTLLGVPYGALCCRRRRHRMCGMRPRPLRRRRARDGVPGVPLGQLPAGARRHRVPAVRHGPLRQPRGRIRGARERGALQTLRGRHLSEPSRPDGVCGVRRWPVRHRRPRRPPLVGLLPPLPRRPRLCDGG